jgi:hypothetical protein
MNASDPVLTRQFPLIQKIYDDEMWFEGERRGHAVHRDDPVVREKVCCVILRMGAEMRAQVMRELATERLRCVANVDCGAGHVAA